MASVVRSVLDFMGSDQTLDEWVERANTRAKQGNLGMVFSVRSQKDDDEEHAFESSAALRSTLSDVVVGRNRATKAMSALELVGDPKIECLSDTLEDELENLTQSEVLRQVAGLANAQGEGEEKSGLLLPLRQRCVSVPDVPPDSTAIQAETAPIAEQTRHGNQEMIPMERFYPGSALGSVSLASGFGVEQVASEPFVTRKDVIVKSSALSSPKVLIHVSETGPPYEDFLYKNEALEHYLSFIEHEKQEKRAELRSRRDSIANRLKQKQNKAREILEKYKALCSKENGKKERWKRLLKNWKNYLISMCQAGKRGNQKSGRAKKPPEFVPWFTYFICLIQALTLVSLLALGGVTSVGVEPDLQFHQDVTTFLGLETVEHWHLHNLWVGPSQTSLIGFGAVFAPCMREDIGITLLYALVRNDSIDAVLGCCQRPLWHIAGTTTEKECLKYTAGKGLWDPDNQCSKIKLPATYFLRPCCYGVQGQCRLTSYHHCEFLEGIFWGSGPEHCSQVNCLSELCKMGGLESNTDLPYLPLNPNQWWRLPLSLLYHHGLVHGMLVLTLQLLLGKSIEAIAGWFRMAFLYLIPGLMALLIGSIFSPYTPLVGGDGAVLGLLGVSLLELLQAWRIARARWKQLAKLLVAVATFALAGTLPYINNFVQLSGFIIGIMCGIVFLPYITFGRKSARVRICLITVTLPLLFVILFITCYIFVHVQSVSEGCSSCRYVNCVPYTDTICKVLELW